MNLVEDPGERRSTAGPQSGPHVLAPDGSPKWNFVWEATDGDYGRADINAAGEVVVRSRWVGVQIRRFSPDGAPVWVRDYSHIAGSIHYLGEVSINDAGEIALAGRTLRDSRAVVLKVDPAGEPVATHFCSPGSDFTTVTIAEDGVLFGGGTRDESAGLPFVAVFD